MPSNRPTPLENSSSAYESSTEEEEDEEEVEEDTPQEDKVGTNSNPPPTSAAPKPHSDEDSSDESSSDESESGDESDVPVEKQTIKPTKTDAPQAKRRLEETEDEDSGKKKKKAASEEQESGKKSEKKLFLRLWTDQDEIVILNGMVEFNNQGKNPSAHVTEFFDSIKHLLRPDVNKLQVHGKIRTIRRKYRNALKKVNNLGEDPEFSKPHDAKVYQLSKKVWYNGESMNLGTADGEKRKSKRVSKATTLPNGSVSDYTYLNASLLPRDILMMPIPAPALGEVFHKKGWNLMGCSNAAGFDKRWKSVLIAETKAYLQRLELVKEQTQAMLDALESSD